MTDSLAAILDVGGNPPRQGDGDDASGLLLDAPEYNRWKALLSTGRVLFGDSALVAGQSELDLRTQFWTSGIRVPSLPQTRPARRPDLFADAGHVYLREKSAERKSGVAAITARTDFSASLHTLTPTRLRSNFA